MPLDWRVTALAGSPQEGTTIQDMMDIRESIQEQKAKAEARRQTDEARRIYQENQGDTRKTLIQLRANGMYAAADLFEANMAKARTQAADAMTKELNNQKMISDDVAEIFNGVNDASSYQTARQRVATKYGPYGLEGLPDTYDPNVVKGIINEGTSIAEQNRRREAATKLLRDGPKDMAEATQWIAGVMAGADDQEDWDSLRGMAKLWGISDDQMVFVPNEFSPAAKAAMIQMSMTPKDAATIVNQQRDDQRAQQAAADLKAYRDQLTKDRQAAADALKKYRDEQQKIARERLARTGAGGRTADDRTFPQGVKDYMTTLSNKYTTFAEANKELQEAEKMLLADHPNLSMEKAENMLEGLFDKKKLQEKQRQESGGQPQAGAAPQRQPTQTLTTAKGTFAIGTPVKDPKTGKRYIVVGIDPESGQLDLRPAGQGK